MLGLIFTKAQNKFQDPAKLRRLIVDLIDNEHWSIDERRCQRRCLRRSPGKERARHQDRRGPVLHPRPLIAAIVDVIAPKPGETICDPACGTGGFLLAAHDYIVKHNPTSPRTKSEHLKQGTFKGWELVEGAARLCAMNLLLHGIGSGGDQPIVVADSLAADPGDRFDIVTDQSALWQKEQHHDRGRGRPSRQGTDIVEREDFWATTSNKQLNFVQHVKTLLKRMGAPRLSCPITSSSRAAQVKPSAENSSTNVMSTPSCACPPASSTPRGQSQRPLFRPQARERIPVDDKALDLRPAYQQALHLKDQSAQRRRPRRFR